MVKKVINSKILIQGLMLSLAVFVTNIAYADGSSNKGSNGQASRSDVSQGQSQAKNESGSQSSQNSSSSNSSLESTSSSETSNKDNQPKTHYGIGYEYRKSMQAQAQKTEQSVGLDKVLLPQRVEPSKNTKDSEPSVEQVDKASRPERPSRP